MEYHIVVFSIFKNHLESKCMYHMVVLKYHLERNIWRNIEEGNGSLKVQGYIGELRENRCEHR